MKHISGLLTTTILLLVSTSVRAENTSALSGAEYSVQRLLLAGSDYFLNVGAKSVYYGKDASRQTLDILAELTWQACSGEGNVEQDTIVWMIRALGHSNNSRYTNVIDQCLASADNAETKKQIQQARDEIAGAILTGGIALPFRQGKLDLKALRKNLYDVDFPSTQDDKDKFKKLNPGQSLDTVLRGFGAPDGIRVTNVVAGRVNQPSPKSAFEDHMIFKYSGLGEMRFSFARQSREWVLENVEKGGGK